MTKLTKTLLKTKAATQLAADIEEELEKKDPDYEQAKARINDSITSKRKRSSSDNRCGSEDTSP